MTARLVIVVAAWVLSATGAFAQGAAQDAAHDRASLVAGGLTAYAEAQAATERDARVAAFARAERLFGQAARIGAANADLHANAGTAALQAERLGPAILAFRRALALDPDHPRARRNLAHARTLLPAWVPRPGDESVLDTFFFWHRALSPAERMGAGAVCFLVAALALAVAVRLRSRLLRSLAIVPALAWVGLLASLAVEAGGEQLAQAVVTADEILARASDSPNAPARFAEPLPGGTEIEIVESRDRWARVRFANGREAWVARGGIEPVLHQGDMPDSPAPAL